MLDGRPHAWRLVADATTLRLDVDGRQVWSAPEREPLDQLRLGDSRTEPDHGGTVALARASYTRRLARPR
jgi:hypothetical protein